MHLNIAGYQDIDIEQPSPGRNPLPPPSLVSLPSLANVLQVDDEDLYQLEPEDEVCITSIYINHTLSHTAALASFPFVRTGCSSQRGD